MRDFFLWGSTDKRYNKEKEHGQRGEKYMATYVISDIHGEYELFISGNYETEGTGRCF